MVLKKSRRNGISFELEDFDFDIDEQDVVNAAGEVLGRLNKQRAQRGDGSDPLNPRKYGNVTGQLAKSIKYIPNRGTKAGGSVKPTGSHKGSVGTNGKKLTNFGLSRILSFGSTSRGIKPSGEIIGIMPGDEEKMEGAVQKELDIQARQKGDLLKGNGRFKKVI